LSNLIDKTIGTGWEDDLDRLKGLEKFSDDKAFRGEFDAAKRANKVSLAKWIGHEMGVKVSPDAMFDVQVKRIHEYKRQLLNILQTVAHYQRIKANPKADFVPRVKIFGGKSAPGYAVAKEIIHLINDVASVVNNDAEVGDRLKIIYPPNYNVSMAERLVREDPEQSRKAIEASPALQGVLAAIAEGQFSPDQKDRFHDLVHRVWHHDYFLVAADFDAYDAAQAAVDKAYADRDAWVKMAALNTARSGFFSSDRTIRSYMKDIWTIPSAL
jgi:glucan phosphorylase